MDVAAALEPYGWGLSSGDYGGVGVGGLATTGGIGWLVREHGLTIDHLRAVEIVLADGSLVHANNEENADLFWAVRGAGANFGIVTSFEFEVDEVGSVGWGQLVFNASNTADFLEKWGATIESAPRNLTSSLIIGPPRRGQLVIAQVLAVVDAAQHRVEKRLLRYNLLLLTSPSLPPPPPPIPDPLPAAPAVHIRSGSSRPSAHHPWRRPFKPGQTPA